MGLLAKCACGKTLMSCRCPKKHNVKVLNFCVHNPGTEVSPRKTRELLAVNSNYHYEEEKMLTDPYPDRDKTLETLLAVARQAGNASESSHPEDMIAAMVAAMDGAALAIMHIHNQS